MKAIVVVSFGLVVGLAVVGFTVVGATVGTSGAFVVAGCPLSAYVYLIDVMLEILLFLTEATPIVYSPEPFVNTALSKLTEEALTFVAYTPSTYTLYESTSDTAPHAK